jgi:hypothetical protein
MMLVAESLLFMVVAAIQQPFYSRIMWCSTMGNNTTATLCVV